MREVRSGSGSAIPYELLMAIQSGVMSYSYRGLPTWKNPFDLALYPMLIERLRPRTIIEIGSNAGGSALWFADTAAAIGCAAHVYSVDLTPPSGPADPRISFLEGDARDLQGAFGDAMLAQLPRPWLIVEDSDHRFETSLAVLRFFDPWLRPGEYIVIEDGILSDMRVAADYGGGPLRAIHAFLAESRGRYAIDRSYCDHFGRNVTWNVDGYLRRE
ncbi:MAG TPA: CmcI family methyltransferase [Allosphingosinicella sp.]|jgi:cephalosporin hydroxylase